jgi:serine/threonine protein kinase/WD40 repeat protein
VNTARRGVPGVPASGPGPGDDEQRDDLDVLADEFLDQHRRGEAPAVAAFVARAGARGDELRELLSALLLVEDLKPRDDDVSETVPGVGGGRRRLAAEPLPERLGDFAIVREVGRGGMGIVYEARQESLGRQVALKVLGPRYASSPRQVQRFLREARSAARLHHTNIVPVFGVGEDDGHHFYVMQFIAGLGLDAVIDELRRLHAPAKDRSAPPAATMAASETVPGAADRPSVTVPTGLVQGPWPDRSDLGRGYARSVAHVGAQAAEALAYAHEHGLLHRDIKPSNLLLDAQGTAWVTDFGLAKAAADEDLTQSGDLVGTLRYMAPERFRGRCDARSDVHALGLTLYELLALRPAFDAPERDRLIYQVTHESPPRLRSVAPAVPPDLETIVQKAIATDPTDRYESAAAMASDLQRFLDDRPIQARRAGPVEQLARWSRRNPHLAALGAAVAGLLAAFVALVLIDNHRLWRKGLEVSASLKEAQRAEAKAMDQLWDSHLMQARASRSSGSSGRRFQALDALARAARLPVRLGRRPDLRDEAIASLALADLQRAETWPGHPGARHPGADFDPSHNRTAAAERGGDLAIRDLTDGRVLFRLGDGDGAREAASLVRFSPDGRYLAARWEGRGPTSTDLWQLEPSRRRVLHLTDGAYNAAFDFDAMRPRFVAGRKDGSFEVFDLETGDRVQALAPGAVPTCARVSPDGASLAVACVTAAETVQWRRLADDRWLAAWTLPTGASSVGWHPEGRWLAAGGEDGRIALLDTVEPSAGPRWLGDGHDARVVALAFHPGGQTLASAGADGTVRLWDVVARRELVKAPSPEAGPILHFSDDGSRLGPGYDGRDAWLWRVAMADVYRRTGRLGEASGAWLRWLDVLPGSDLVVSAGSDGLRIGSVETPSVGAALELPGIQGLAVHPDGSALFTSGSAGLLRWPVQRRDDGREMVLGPPEPAGFLEGAPTGAVRLSHDGSTLALVIDAEAGRVVVFAPDDPSRRVEMAGPADLGAIALSPDGRWLAAGSSHGPDVTLGDARRGRIERRLPVADGADVAFSPDGRWLVTGSGSQYVVWNAATWQARDRHPREDAGGQPGTAAFSADSRLLAVSRTRRLVDLLDAATGRTLATFESPEPRLVSALSLGADGRWLLIGARGGGLQAWDLATTHRRLDALGLGWEAPPTGTLSAAASSNPSQAVIRVRIVGAPWMEPFSRGEALAVAGRWDDAGRAYAEAIAAGAVGVEAWTRHALFRLAANDPDGYRRVCQSLVERFGDAAAGSATANNVAWACAIGPDALGGHGPRLFALARDAAEVQPLTNRLNTVGAVLFRDGRHAEALEWFARSVAAHGAGGTPYDALFLAMTHHALGHADEARHWLERATDRPPVAMRKPDVAGPSAWIPRLELDLLRREAQNRLGPASPD